MTLSIEHLTGGYTQTPVIKDINFEVKNGELLGLIGLNGAGKSTTINHVIGLMRPMKGKIILDEIDLEQNPTQYKTKLAYIPELPILYDELTLKEHIELTIKAYEMNSEKAWQQAHKLLKTFRLENKLDWFPANFSKGMRQKVMIVCAFITDAELFVVDEPFIGLDPLAIDDLLKVINEKKQQGASILMSTHVLDTAEKYCDRFALLNEGELKAVGTLADFQKQFNLPNSSLNDIYLTIAKGERDE